MLTIVYSNYVSEWILLVFSAQRRIYSAIDWIHLCDSQGALTTEKTFLRIRIHRKSKLAYTSTQLYSGALSNHCAH
jgi:hypothetical protein